MIGLSIHFIMYLSHFRTNKDQSFFIIMSCYVKPNNWKSVYFHIWSFDTR